MTTVLLGLPHNGTVSAKRQYCLTEATTDESVRLLTSDVCSSLLAYGHNCLVAAAKNERPDYFAILHSDVVPTAGWINQLIDDLGDGEVIHAPVLLKNRKGLTSTAIAYGHSPMSMPNRRLTLRQLADLPAVFGAAEARKMGGNYVLPNTGCMLIKCSSWFYDWPGFQMHDTIVKQGDEYVARTVSEDWTFGYWLGHRGLECKVSQNVKTTHYGTAKFSTGVTGGWPDDKDWHFETAWMGASERPGWLTRQEAQALFDAVITTTGDILEIGTYCGRSTQLLASLKRPVTTVDVKRSEWEFPENVRRITMPSQEYSHSGEIGMLYIDGDHTRAMEDFDRFEPHLADGAKVAFHDATTDQNVHDALQHAIATGKLRQLQLAGSMWIGQAA